VKLFDVHGMPPKAKAGALAQLSGTTSNTSPNLGGRPKKQKVVFDEVCKPNDIAPKDLGSKQSRRSSVKEIGPPTTWAIRALRRRKQRHCCQRRQRRQLCGVCEQLRADPSSAQQFWLSSR
jgi:hypothetical protein